MPLSRSGPLTSGLSRSGRVEPLRAAAEELQEPVRVEAIAREVVELLPEHVARGAVLGLERPGVALVEQRVREPGLVDPDELVPLVPAEDVDALQRVEVADVLQPRIDLLAELACECI